MSVHLQPPTIGNAQASQQQDSFNELEERNAYTPKKTQNSEKHKRIEGAPNIELETLTRPRTPNYHRLN